LEWSPLIKFGLLTTEFYIERQKFLFFRVSLSCVLFGVWLGPLAMLSIKSIAQLACSLFPIWLGKFKISKKFSYEILKKFG
jgi:hypothetical protein